LVSALGHAARAPPPHSLQVPRQRAGADGLTMDAAMHYCLFDTDLGACGVAWSERGLARFQLPEGDQCARETRLSLSGADSRAEAPPPQLEKAIADVQRYMAGERVDFS